MATSRSKRRGSAAISPTAFYTGYIWYRNGLSHPAFLTPEGERFYRFGQPMMRLSHLFGGPTLEGFLLARHRIIDHLLTEAIDSGRVSQVIEIAAGLSPRGWRFTQRYGKALTYIEADLPGMAARKRRLLEDAKLMGADHRVVDFDALATEGPNSLDAIAQTLDPRRGVAVITEGLLNYLHPESVKGLWQRIASTTLRFPAGLYLSDIHLLEGNRSAFSIALSVLLTPLVRGQLHKHFRNTKAAEQALRTAGFASARLINPVGTDSPIREDWLPGAKLVRIIEACN
jgi:O-methyltransferase involved in polyketide biosynthesis